MQQARLRSKEITTSSKNPRWRSTLDMISEQADNRSAWLTSRKRMITLMPLLLLLVLILHPKVYPKSRILSHPANNRYSTHSGMTGIDSWDLQCKSVLRIERLAPCCFDKSLGLSRRNHALFVFVNRPRKSGKRKSKINNETNENTRKPETCVTRSSDDVTDDCESEDCPGQASGFWLKIDVMMTFQAVVINLSRTISLRKLLPELKSCLIWTIIHAILVHVRGDPNQSPFWQPFEITVSSPKDKWPLLSQICTGNTSHPPSMWHPSNIPSIDTVSIPTPKAFSNPGSGLRVSFCWTLV